MVISRWCKWQRRAPPHTKHFNQLPFSWEETAAQLVALQTIVSLWFLLKQPNLLSRAVLQPYAPVAESCCRIKTPQHISEVPAASVFLLTGPWEVLSAEQPVSHSTLLSHAYHAPGVITVRPHGNGKHTVTTVFYCPCWCQALVQTSHWEAVIVSLRGCSGEQWPHYTEPNRGWVTTIIMIFGEINASEWWLTHWVAVFFCLFVF